MASDLRHWSREFFAEFLELYESFPCLWQIASKDYRDRNKKMQAYAVLVNKYKEVDSEANRELVIRKINSFRTVYRKECAKIKASMSSGGEIYKPSLWYFDLLSFLSDGQPRISQRSMEVAVKEEEDEQVSLDDDDSKAEPPFSAPSTPGEESMDILKETLSSYDAPSFSSTRKRKYESIDDPTTKLLQLAEKKAICFDDEFDAFGKYLVLKLRSLKGNQHIFARKLINDVIFEAELETLTKDFKIVNSAAWSGPEDRF